MRPIKFLGRGFSLACLLFCYATVAAASLTINPGQSGERAYLYRDSGSGLGGGARYADRNNFWIYRIPGLNGEITLEAEIEGQYEIGFSTDGQRFTALARETLRKERATLRLSLSKLQGETVYLKFSDPRPVDGWGPSLYALHLIKNENRNGAREEEGKVELNVPLTFVADGSLKERQFLFENKGSAVDQSGPHRYADREAYWVYAFPVPKGAKSGRITLSIGNQYLVEVSPDGENFEEVGRREKTGRPDNVTIDLTKLLLHSPSQIYIRIGDAHPTDGYGGYVRNVRVVFSERELPVFAGLPQEPPSMSAKKFATAPKIDGMLDDTCWQTAAKTNTPFYLNSGDNYATEQTEVFLGYDENTLYIAFRCWESELDKVRRRVKIDNGNVWTDDCVEVFIDPFHDHQTEYHFAVNSLGTRFAQKNMSVWVGSWEAAAQMGKGYWTVEIALPFANFEISSETAKTWGINFCREEKRIPENSSWSPTFGGFHNPSKFGHLEGLELPWQEYFLTATLGEFTPQLGKNLVPVKLKNLAEEAQQYLISLTASRADGGAKVEQALTLSPKQEVSLELPLELAQRGEYTLRLSVKNSAGGERYISQPFKLTLVDLLTVDLPRNTFYQSFAKEELTVFAQIIPDHTVTSAGDKLNLIAFLVVEGKEGTENGLMRKEVELSAKEGTQTTEFRWPLAGLPPGRYQLRVELCGAKGEKFDVKSLPFVYYPKGKNECLIDNANNLWVNGQPFFPIGIYHVSTDLYPELARRGFNTVQISGKTSEGTQRALDLAYQEGLRVLFEMSDTLRGQENYEEIRRRVEKFRTHPAILAWYSIDEPELSTDPKVVAQAYQVIKEADPYHPVYIVNYIPGRYQDWVAGTDILATDPYPVPNSNLTLVREWTLAARKATRDRKPVWIIPQIHDTSYGKGRFPTPVEERNMVYQAIVHGAKGIIYYGYGDLYQAGATQEQIMTIWDAVAAINFELKELAPVILSLEEVPVEVESKGKGIDYLAKVYQGELYLLAVNTTPQPLQAEFSLKGSASGEVMVLFEDRNLPLAQGWKDHFEGYGVHVYKVKLVSP